jgi:hypothetical protein
MPGAIDYGAFSPDIAQNYAACNIKVSKAAENLNNVPVISASG